jgi:hypothetical protein
MATWTRESGATASSSTVLKNLSEDTAPQLGGTLDVKAFVITTTTTDGNISLVPNGTGEIVLSQINLSGAVSKIHSLPTADPSISGRLFTQTAAELGGAGSTKVICVSS